MKTPFAVPSSSKQSIKILQHIKLQAKQQNEDADSSLEILEGSFSEVKPINAPRQKQNMDVVDFHPQGTSTPYEEISSASSESESETDEPAIFLNEAKSLIKKAKITLERKNFKKLRYLRKLERYRLNVYKLEVRLNKIEQVISIAEQISKIDK